jgi:hypothetical protein
MRPGFVRFDPAEPLYDVIYRLVHFADLVLRHGGMDLYMHLFRAVYATIAVYFYCPQQINATLFKAEIQGHRMVADASTKRLAVPRRERPEPERPQRSAGTEAVTACGAEGAGGVG